MGINLTVWWSSTGASKPTDILLPSLTFETKMDAAQCTFSSSHVTFKVETLFHSTSTHLAVRGECSHQWRQSRQSSAERKLTQLCETSTHGGDNIACESWGYLCTTSNLLDHLHPNLLTGIIILHCCYGYHSLSVGVTDCWLMSSLAVVWVLPWPLLPVSCCLNLSIETSAQ